MSLNPTLTSFKIENLHFYEMNTSQSWKREGKLFWNVPSSIEIVLYSHPNSSHSLQALNTEYKLSFFGQWSIQKHLNVSHRCTPPSTHGRKKYKVVENQLSYWVSGGKSTGLCCVSYRKQRTKLTFFRTHSRIDAFTTWWHRQHRVQRSSGK